MGQLLWHIHGANPFSHQADQASVASAAGQRISQEAKAAASGDNRLRRML